MCLKEAGVLEEVWPVVVEEIDDEAFDVGAIGVLISHDHDVPVAQALRPVLILVALLKAQDGLEVLDLLVLHNLLVIGVARVSHLATEGEHAVAVAADDGKPRHRQCLGRVSLRQNERAVHCVFRAGIVGVFELGDAGDAPSLFAIRLLHVLSLPHTQSRKSAP